MLFFIVQRRRAQLEAQLQQLTLDLAEEAGPRRPKRSRGDVIDKARLWGPEESHLHFFTVSSMRYDISDFMRSPIKVYYVIYLASEIPPILPFYLI